MKLRDPQDRKVLDLRPLSIETSVTRYAEGSALIKAGNTHVLCTASVDENIPSWLKGKAQGWITAEYSMLPRSTHTRSKRDREKISGRTQEIQRLIGRALRGCIDLKLLGERQIILDCDVLQADGGTRTASITGACVALAQAIARLEKEGKVSSQVWKNTVAAISVGMKNQEILVDLDYEEDSHCDVDMNFVMNGSGNFIEIQGTAEHQSFNADEMKAMTEAATSAIKQITKLQKEKISSFQ